MEDEVVEPVGVVLERLRAGEDDLQKRSTAESLSASERRNFESSLTLPGRFGIGRRSVGADPHREDEIRETE